MRGTAPGAACSWHRIPGQGPHRIPLDGTRATSKTGKTVYLPAFASRLPRGWPGSASETIMKLCVSFKNAGSLNRVTISLIHPGHTLLIHFSCIYKECGFFCNSYVSYCCSSVKTEVQNCFVQKKQKVHSYLMIFSPNEEKKLVYQSEQLVQESVSKSLFSC